MTLGQLLELLKVHGVTEQTHIDSIEIGMAKAGTGRIVVSFTEHGEAEIREVTV